MRPLSSGRGGPESGIAPFPMAEGAKDCAVILIRNGPSAARSLSQGLRRRARQARDLHSTAARSSRQPAIYVLHVDFEAEEAGYRADIEEPLERSNSRICTRREEPDDRFAPDIGHVAIGACFPKADI